MHSVSSYKARLNFLRPTSCWRSNVNFTPCPAVGGARHNIIRDWLSWWMVQTGDTVSPLQVFFLLWKCLNNPSSFQLIFIFLRPTTYFFWILNFIIVLGIWIYHSFQIQNYDKRIKRIIKLKCFIYCCKIQHYTQSNQNISLIPFYWIFLIRLTLTESVAL